MEVEGGGRLCEFVTVVEGSWWMMKRSSWMDSQWLKVW